MTLEESSEVIREEYELLQPLREDLLRKHPGKYVLFRHGEMQSVHDSFDDAYGAGLRKYGLDNTFLIEHLVDEESKIRWDLGFRYAAR